MKPITLTLNSLSLSIDRFPKQGYSRNPAISNDDQDYNINGDAAVTGIAFAMPHLWQIKCYLNPVQWETLNLLWNRSDRLRRSGEPFAITLDDYKLAIVEDPPRTRLPAAGTVATGYSYFARFRARMTVPTAIPSGNPNFPYLASFNIWEI